MSGITLVSAAEYRYDGGRQRYLVRQRDPNDDYAVIGDAQWRDYFGDEIHRDYTVDPAIGGGSSGHDGVTSNASYLAGVGYDDGTANAPAYFSANQIGTTRRIADSNGCDNAPPDCSPAILHRKISTAFGEPMSTANATGFDHPRYGYAGAWGYEEPRAGDPLELLGWLHVGERYYAPELGRFVQRDPIGIRGGLNVYEYTRSSPAEQIDPDGLNFLDPSGPLVLTEREKRILSELNRRIPGSRFTPFYQRARIGIYGRHILRSSCLVIAAAAAGAIVGRVVDNEFGARNNGFRISDGLADIIYRWVYDDGSGYDPWGIGSSAPVPL